MMFPRMRVKDSLHAHRMFKEIEYCMNNRPLFATSSADTEVLATTPFQFLSVNPKNSPYVDEDGALDRHVLLKLRSCQVRCLEKLWHHMKESYLIELQKAHEKRGSLESRVPKVGDIVLLKRIMTARSFWPIARVVELLVGDKGRIRAVRVEIYVPDEINAEVAFAKYKVTSLKQLTKNQRRELTGYFKPVQEPQTVRNLIPLEIWKTDAYMHEDAGAVINRTLSKDEDRVDEYDCPTVDTINPQFRRYKLMDPSWSTVAKDLLRTFGCEEKKETDQEKQDRILMRMNLAI